MQKFLFVGAVILLVAALANIFLQLPALMLTISRDGYRYLLGLLAG